MNTATTSPAETAYFAALESFRLISKAHRAVTLRYRNREIGDAAFLASRGSLEDASKAVDAAESAYVRESHDAAFTSYQLPDGTIINVDSTAAKGEPVIGFTLKGGQVVNATLVRQ